jgi:hypothetical protein
VGRDHSYGWPSTFLADKKTNSINSSVHSDRWLTVLEVAAGAGTSLGLCFTISTENLDLRHVCNILSTHSQEQTKKNTLNICTNHLHQSAADENFTKLFTTGMETCLLQCQNAAALFTMETKIIPKTEKAKKLDRADRT